ncbi:MAG TPA: 50S ribosomal protein L25 [Polyangia bacterium]|jgi:large subunit ribosomal protein L25|nr:50S ribosomal protein L25 [Polyangia bacterium]
MDFAKVSVELRKQSGKGGSRKVRAGGKVPGVLYGHKAEPLSVTLNEKALLQSLDKERRRNTVFTLSVLGGAKTEEVTAMIRDAQIDPMSRRLIHVDFLRISLDEEVNVTVPLVLIGKAVGVTNGGNLHQSMHAIPVAAKPAAIPTKLEVDVTILDIGMALHVSDLKLAAGVRALLDPKDAIASVVAPKAEKVEAEVAPVEGAVPAEGAAAAGAAAPEGGTAKAAPGAAPAPAKKEGEKKGK